MHARNRNSIFLDVTSTLLDFALTQKRRSTEFSRVVRGSAAATHLQESATQTANARRSSSARSSLESASVNVRTSWRLDQAKCRFEASTQVTTGHNSEGRAGLKACPTSGRIC